ncbi:Calx-beta domain-containing protein [Luteolibacter sp. Y139]|uniref:Calx-beta domain-containing protein n=1 Tax=Luteolibacter soli TaxID=3135280 RepID=A0ABU9ATA1_9BACT
MYPPNWEFMGASDHDVVLRGGNYPNEGGHLGFITRDRSHILRGVDPGMYVVALVARENDFVLHGSTRQGHVFARMEQPPYRPGEVVKAKVSRVKAKPETVRHFGRHFALFEQGGAFHLLAWGAEEAESIQRVPGLARDIGISGITETEEAVYIKSGLRDLLRIAPGEKEAKFTKVTLPAGLSMGSIRGGKENELFILSPLETSIVRLNTTPVSQLEIYPAVGREIDGVMRFKVRLEPASQVPVSFSYETRPRGAEAGVDYAPVGGTATLAPGATEAVVEVPLIEDFTIESSESFELHLTGISGARCERPVTTGRILGSSSPRKLGITFDIGAQSEFERSNASSVVFPEGVAEASRLGCVGLSPMTPNSGPYFYASATTFEWAEQGGMGGKIYQFDAVTGELLEEMPDRFRRVEGNEVLTVTGIGSSVDSLMRWGFFDGFPVLDFSAQALVEGGGFQELVARAERSHKAIDCKVLTADPALGVTGISVDGDGRFQLQASPPDDGAVRFTRTFDVEVRLTDRESGATSIQLVPVRLADDDFLLTKQVKLGGKEIAQTLLADGDRLLAGYTGFVDTFRVSGEILTGESRTMMPKGAVALRALEPAGPRVVFSTITNKAQNGLQLSGLERGVKGWKSKSAERPKAMVLAGQYLAAGEGQAAGGASGRVRILDAASGKELRVIEAPDGSPGFGYDLAFSAGTLWVASPPSGMPFGKVYGYSVADFSLIHEISNPEPAAGGIFGISIAVDGDQLVVGEPRNGGGAVWLFDASSGTLLGKLASLANKPVPGLGVQVATRGGRILAAGGNFLAGLAPSSAPASVASKVSTSSVIIIINPTPPNAESWLPVVLWEDRSSSPRYLHPNGAGTHYFTSGGHIALLDGAAVHSYASFTGDGWDQGLEVYYFPEPAVAGSTMAASAPRATALPLWPQGGAPEPRWTFHRTEAGGLEAEVNMGASVTVGTVPQVEWSGDLKVWYLMTELPEPAGGLLRIPLPAGDTSRRFLRLRTSGDE